MPALARRSLSHWWTSAPSSIVQVIALAGSPTARPMKGKPTLALGGATPLAATSTTIASLGESGSAHQKRGPAAVPSGISSPLRPIQAVVPTPTVGQSAGKRARSARTSGGVTTWSRSPDSRRSTVL